MQRIIKYIIQLTGLYCEPRLLDIPPVPVITTRNTNLELHIACPRSHLLKSYPPSAQSSSYAYAYASHQPRIVHPAYAPHSHLNNSKYNIAPIITIYVEYSRILTLIWVLIALYFEFMITVSTVWRYGRMEYGQLQIRRELEVSDGAKEIS